MSLQVNINFDNTAWLNIFSFKIRTNNNPVLNHIFYRTLIINININESSQVTLSHNWLSNDETPSSLEEQTVEFDSRITYPNESRSDSESVRRSNPEFYGPPTLEEHLETVREELETLRVANRLQRMVDSSIDSDYAE